jgi:hypothetical protein
MHISHPYIYVKKIYKKLTIKEKETITEGIFKKL